MNTAEFLADWYGGQTFTLTTISPTGGKPTGQTFQDPVAGAQYAAMQNAAGRNVYFHVNAGANIPDPTTGVASGKLTKGELTHLLGVHVDIDPPEGVTPENVEHWKQSTINGLPNPTRVTCSGRGLAAYWKFDAPVVATPETIDRIEQMNRALVRMFNGDKAAIDASRIMKLAGTTAFPNNDKRAAGWNDAPATLVAANDITFDAVQLEAWCHQNAPAMPQPTTAPAVVDDAPISPEEFATLCGKVERKLRGGKNAMVLDTGIPVRNGTDDPSEIWGWMMRATAEVTSRRDVAQAVLLSFPFCDLTYPPSDGTRRQKCERELLNHWGDQVTATADRRATGSLEGLKELSGRTLTENAGELAQYAAKLSGGERDALYEHVKAVNPSILKPLMSQTQVNINDFRTGQAEHVYGMLKGGELGKWLIVGNDGKGKAAAINRHNGSTMTFEAMVTRYAHLPQIAVPAGDKIKMVSAVQHWWTDPATERYDELGFDPNAGDWWGDGVTTYRNSYTAAHMSPAPVGLDTSPFDYLLSANYPDEGDRYVLLSALAFAIQRPGQMLQWAPVLQGSQGCGKGTLIKPVLTHCLDRKFVGVASPKTLSGEFNAYMYRKVVTIVDEIGERSKAAMSDLIEELKEPVSEDFVPFRVMNVDPFSGDNFTCWFFMTNHMDSMLANDPNERRWAQLVSALQTAEDVRAALNGAMWSNYPDVVAAAGGTGKSWFAYYRVWWSMGGNEAVRGMLENHPVAEVGNAPHTSTKEAAVAASLPEMVTLIREAVRNGEAGFKGGFASAFAIKELLAADNVRAPSKRWFGEQMKQAGFAHNVRFTPTPAEVMRFPECRGKTRLYFSDGSLLDRYDPQQIASLYDQAQATGDTPVVPNNVVPMK